VMTVLLAASVTSLRLDVRAIRFTVARMESMHHIDVVDAAVT